MSLASKRIKKLYNESLKIPFDSSSKFIIMSDLHRGQGGNNDNFVKNRNIFLGAMEYYLNSGFTYIELGDGDELWENRKMENIIRENCDIFSLLSCFYRKNRFFMLSGNHDFVKIKGKFKEKYLNSYYNECMQRKSLLFPNLVVHEGLILKNKENKNEILLLHGHQGSILNDVLWPLARFLVRFLWKPLESIGVLSPSLAKGPTGKTEKTERTLSRISKEMRKMLICGHTHKMRFPKAKEGLYFNSGSGVSTGYITGIEIENLNISLVKWSVKIKKDRSLYVGREIIKGPEKISDYFEKSC